MTEQELLLKADEFIEANMEDIIRDIKAVVDIPSVKSEAKEGAPFGVEVRRALGKALEIGERMGFKTVNCGERTGRGRCRNRSAPRRPKRQRNRACSTSGCGAGRQRMEHGSL